VTRGTTGSRRYRRVVEDKEWPVAGGNVSVGLVRIGDTLRRPSGPWSHSVHHFLTHLAAVGYDGAPRSLGFDEQGRHVLEWVPGHVLMPFHVEESHVALRRVGRLLRELHDASAEYVPPVDAHWNVVVPPDRRDLIVHHDAAPWNLVLGGDRWAFIDWDTAAPGSRLWDLAYAAHGFIPLAPATAPSVAGRLLVSLVDGYGLTEAQRVGLADVLAPRVRSMFTLLQQGARDRVQPWARLWADGHGEVWREDADYVEQHRALLLAVLLDQG
jgi:hypothetical protein